VSNVLNGSMPAKTAGASLNSRIGTYKLIAY